MHPASIYLSDVEEEDIEEEGESILDRLKHRISLFGNIKDSDMLKGAEEEEEEFIHSEKRLPLKKHHKHHHHKQEFDLPELMKYGEYDKKAWNFFKRHQDDI